MTRKTGCFGNAALRYFGGWLVRRALFRLRPLICSPEAGSVWGKVFRFCSLGGEERRAIKASRFSHAQKAFIPKQGADGVPVAEIRRWAWTSEATYFNWKKEYEGLTPPRC